MKRRRPAAFGAAAVAAAALTIAGCGGTETASTAQSTISTAPPITTASPTTDTVPTTTTTTVAPPTRPGSAKIGKDVFAAKCSGCHEGLGTRAAFGPKLAGKGLTRAVIRVTVRNGRNQMPAGRATGQDYEDVVAYVLSLQ